MSKEFQIRDGNLIASFDLENEDGDINFCKLLKVSHGVTDEIGMFVDYVATNKIIKDQSNQISDLEAKLAEKEEEIEELSSMVSVFSKSSLSQLKDFIVDKPLLQLGYTKYLEDKISQTDQDKISFAVEQLEKVKDYILTTQQDADYLVDKEQVNIHFFKDVIDNQIKKLTHQHEDKGE